MPELPDGFWSAARVIDAVHPTALIGLSQALAAGHELMTEICTIPCQLANR